MPLTPGTRIGPYQIVAKLGEGGMGEVYRARDARLERDVALKVLPESFARDPDRLARFEREARAVASLSHPNILSVFDTGTAVPAATGEPSTSFHPVSYVVMELLTGETLGDRLKSGPLPLRKATEIGALVARGLAAAHEKGLVHRDLKPDNVFLTSDGQVKLLDFGLARFATEASEVQATRPAITDAGTVMGTVGYMAPEQVRGEVVDARADLFALGAVLYEMLTGAQAFRRNTNAETMTAILNEDPPELPPSRAIAPALDRIVRHCLEKRAAERFQTARDVAFALDALSVSSSTSAPAVVEAARGRMHGERMAWLAATVVLAGLAAWLAFDRRTVDPEPAAAFRAWVLPPAGTALAGWVAPARRLALSADGRRLAFLTQARDSEQTSLWWQTLDAETSTLVSGTRIPSAPFWSPDGRHLGYFDDGRLMRMSVESGASAAIGKYEGAAAWGPNDAILINPSRSSIRLLAPGGEERVLFSGESSREIYGYPTFVSGNRLLFLLVHPADPKASGIYLAGVDGGTRRQITTWAIETDAMNAHAASGHLLVVRDRMIQARRFDSDSGTVGNEWVVLAGPVETGERGSAAYAVSDRVLAYQPATTSAGTRLVWYNRSGQRLSQLGEDGDYSNLELSADGTRVLLSAMDPQARTRDIWAWDVRRGVPTRVTFDRLDERSAAWGPDGQSIVYRKGVDLFTRPLAGGTEQPFVVDGLSKDPRGWSPDGKAFVYRVNNTAGGSSDLWMKPAAGEPRPLVASPFTENYGEFSPDGRWLAYTSDESGQLEVYVTDFPSAQGKWRISPDGGSLPRWRGDGRELYYVSAANQLMAVPVRASGATFDVDQAVVLFQTNLTRVAGSQYVVTADGARFLINEVIPSESRQAIGIVVNWPSLVQGR